MKKLAIITFDYEVFLGSATGTVENCVIIPTKAILDILKINNAKAIFFVDATWLLFLQENFINDFIKVQNQLRKIEASGSSVELHLHPQWLDAEVVEGKIIFKSLKHYTLQSLTSEQILELFKRSVNLLNSIKGSDISCFRAGGWCIDPFDKIVAAFINCGIKYDFSVVPGKSINEGKTYDYNYTMVPSLPFYNFNNDVVRAEENGAFTEIPVSTYTSNAFLRILNRILLKYKRDKTFGDGRGAKEKPVMKRAGQALLLSKSIFTLDKTDSVLFRILLNTYFKRSSLVVVVSHPKILSRQALFNLSYLAGRYQTIGSSDLGSLPALKQ